jgi:hydroxyethylthiazole kinase-like uncharacterized protein yjeF
MRIVSTREMRKIEEMTSTEFNIKEELIIENAGSSGSRVLYNLIKDHGFTYEVIFLIGKGHNGADGMAMARHLSNLGVRSRAFILFAKNECNDPELLSQIAMASSLGVTINYIDNSSQLSGYFDQMGCELVVDAIFGTGVQLPLSNFLHEVIDIVNDNSQLTVSVDIPSGVEGDTGLIRGKAINASLTLAIGFPKLGHYISDGAKHSGDIYTLDVGFPRSFNNEGDKFLLKPKHMIDLVGVRDKFADKKVFGHSLVLAGSHGLTGAAALSSLASLRVGSGLVTVATWEPQYQELVARLEPEILTGYLPLDITKWDPLIKDLNKYSSIVIGPGLAKSSRARRLVLEVLNNYDGPVVIDADAINVLSMKEDKNVFTMRNAPTVLTPHFGEFAKFMGIDTEELKMKPVHYLKELVDGINCTVVLKGPCTFLGCTDGSVYFNYCPNDGMATSGAGDVLAGILGGLLGQEDSLRSKDKLNNKYESFNRAIAVSIYLHSISGKFAAEKQGVRAMSAKTIIESFSSAFKVLDDDINEVLGSI